ncbi:MAG: pyridoxal phosphate-dependent aminotransferase family protein [Calditrichaeota bacterium]|nr:pyridoxal phosphate-dependent aminotransferase family protein [Calditrichota bacterium]
MDAKHDALAIGPVLKFDGPNHVWYEGKRLLYCAGTDYHRLGFEPEVQESVQQALHQQGLGAGGSRVTTGNNALLLELEATLAQFFGVEAALMVGSGYLANLVLLQAVRQQFDVVLADAQAHASLMDGVRAVGLPVEQFAHRDSQDLERRLRAWQGKSVLVVTDGIFAARGEIAPLDEYWQLTQNYQAQLLVDDAHGMAVLGTLGRGTVEHFGIPFSEVWVTGTLSKGFGVFGGVILGNRQLIQQVVQHSAAFVGHTPMPVPMMAGALAAVKFLQQHPSRVTLLNKRALEAKQTLRDAGYAIEITPVPILSVAFPEKDRVEAFRQYLLKNEIFPPFNWYPGAPAGGHFRFVVTSAHPQEQIDRLLETITRFLQGHF